MGKFNFQVIDNQRRSSRASQYNGLYLGANYMILTGSFSRLLDGVLWVRVSADVANQAIRIEPAKRYAGDTHKLCFMGQQRVNRLIWSRLSKALPKGRYYLAGGATSSPDKGFICVFHDA